MFQVILACTPNFGIGKNMGLPWNCPEELKIFREKTLNQVVIMGRKTMVSIPKLDNRTLICLSKNISSSTGRTKRNEFTICKNLNDAIAYAQSKYPEKKIFVAGGASLYNEVLNDKDISRHISAIHISIFKEETSCDVFVKFPDFSKYEIITHAEYDQFNHYKLKYNVLGEYQYNSLLNKVLNIGDLFQGRNGATFSHFGENLKFDLARGFPLLTGKKMFFRGIVEELLFFLRGETDTKILEDKGIKIWNQNTEKSFLNSKKLDYREGLMGPMYGYQWRFFNAPYEKDTGKSGGGFYIDQLEKVIKMIKTDPYSRRILMTSYNPLQAEEGVLYPCHSLMIQFHVKEGILTSKPEGLSMYCFNRSSDLFLGLPFNISSSALLLSIVAKATNLKPEYLHISLGNAHIYRCHKEVVEQYLTRVPLYAPPKLSIKKEINRMEDINSLKYTDFVLENYHSYDKLPAPMVA